MPTLKEMVVEYNQFIIDNNIKDIPPVKRFSDRPTAEKRLEQLRSMTVGKQIGKRFLARDLLKGVERSVAREKPIVLKGPSKRPKPVDVCREIFKKMVKENPNVYRREYVQACMAEGINASTAARQWSPEWKKLRARK